MRRLQHEVFAALVSASALAIGAAPAFAKKGIGDCCTKDLPCGSNMACFGPGMHGAPPPPTEDSDADEGVICDESKGDPIGSAELFP